MEGPGDYYLWTHCVHTIFLPFFHIVLDVHTHMQSLVVSFMPALLSFPIKVAHSCRYKEESLQLPLQQVLCCPLVSYASCSFQLLVGLTTQMGFSDP